MAFRIIEGLGKTVRKNIRIAIYTCIPKCFLYCQAHQRVAFGNLPIHNWKSAWWFHHPSIKDFRLDFQYRTAEFPLGRYGQVLFFDTQIWAEDVQSLKQPQRDKMLLTIDYRWALAFILSSGYNDVANEIIILVLKRWYEVHLHLVTLFVSPWIGALVIGNDILVAGIENLLYTLLFCR